MDCQQAKDGIQALIDNVMDSKDLTETMDHLKTCPQCRREYSLFLLLSKELKRLPLQSPDPGFNQTVFRRLGIACPPKKQPAWLGWMLTGGLSFLASWLAIMLLTAYLLMAELPFHRLFFWMKNPDLMISEIGQGFLILGYRAYENIAFVIKILGMTMRSSYLPLQLMISSLLAMAFIAIAMHYLKPKNI